MGGVTSGFEDDAGGRGSPPSSSGEVQLPSLSRHTSRISSTTAGTARCSSAGRCVGAGGEDDRGGLMMKSQRGLFYGPEKPSSQMRKGEQRGIDGFGGRGEEEERGGEGGGYEEDGLQAASLYFATGTWWQQEGHDPESFVMTHSDKR